MYWYLFQRSSKQLPVTNQDFPTTKRSTKQRIPLPSRVRYVALVMTGNGWGKSWGRVRSVENIWVSLILSVQIRSSGLGVSWICSRLSKWLTFHLFVYKMSWKQSTGPEMFRSFFGRFQSDNYRHLSIFILVTKRQFHKLCGKVLSQWSQTSLAP